MRMIVNRRPVSDNGLTSVKPTVDMVITAIYKASIKLKFSITINPAVPNNMVSSNITIGSINLENNLSLFICNIRFGIISFENYNFNGK